MDDLETYLAVVEREALSHDVDARDVANHAKNLAAPVPPDTRTRPRLAGWYWQPSGMGCSGSANSAQTSGVGEADIR